VGVTASRSLMAKIKSLSYHFLFYFPLLRTVQIIFKGSHRFCKTIASPNPVVHGSLRRHLHLLWCLVMLLLNVRLASSLAVETKHIAIIGGGASGIFSAISAAEHLVDIRKKEKQTTNVKVVVFEATSKTLTKVAISGGGRCNVLHDTSKPTSELLNGYPRGKKELTGLLSSRYVEREDTTKNKRIVPSCFLTRIVVSVLYKKGSHPNKPKHGLKNKASS